METMFSAESAWMQQRLGKFTASQIGRLMPKGKGKDEPFSVDGNSYINEVLAEILTGESAESGPFKQFEWGHANEFEAIQAIEESQGISIEYFGGGNPKFFPFNPQSGGSPDGLTDELLIEVKCPYRSAVFASFLIAARTQESPATWLQKKFPIYYGQVQFNMLCTGRKNALLASYDPRPVDASKRLALLPVPLNTEYTDELQERLELAIGVIKKSLAALNKPSLLIASKVEGATLIEQG